MTRLKKMKLCAVIFTIFSFLLTWTPVLVYTCLAYMSKTASDTGKVCLTMFLSVAVIMSLVCILNKYTLRCKNWLLLIGLWMCLDKILGCILVLAITQCLDELVVSPLAKHFRTKVSINKEISKVVQ